MSLIGGLGNELVEGRCGDGSADEVAALTAVWFEGRMLSEGELGIWCEDWRRDEDAVMCGDGGTELRSGMVTVWLRCCVV